VDKFEELIAELNELSDEDKIKGSGN